MIIPMPIMSPRITLLEQSLNGGNISALDIFWQEITTHGAPLIEAIDGDETQLLVTFLWRDPGDTSNVIVLYGSLYKSDLASHQMERLLMTNLWYKTYVLPSDLHTTYQFSVNGSLVPFEKDEDWLVRGATFRPDPLNSHEFTLFVALPGQGKVSILQLPKAPQQPWIIAQRSVAKGNVKMHLLDSHILHNKQHITVYTPPNYQENGEAYGLFVLFDGWAYLNFASTPTMMDNLLHAGKIPPYVVVMHSNLDPRVREHELACYPPFCEFLVQELIPWVYSKYHVTVDPAKTIVGGSSVGGLAAAFVAFKNPEIFGNVISQSGSFWWNGKENDDSEAEWLTRQFAMSPKLPLRFSMEVGLLEQTTEEIDQVTANRNMRDTLLSKGYEVDYAEYNGGHDYVCWRGSLADRFLWLAAKGR